jgi:factor associated with neutral sphingomyelinase activation
MNKGIDSSLSASFSSSLTSQHILSLPSHMHPHPSFHGEFQQTLDPINLQSPWEQVMTPNLSCFLLSPLNLTPGGCVVTLQQLYFQPWKGHWDSTTSHRKRVCPPKASSWSLSSIVATARRYHGLRDVALEIFFQSEPSILLAFTSCKDRESVLQQLSQLPCHTDEKFIAQSLKAWLDGTIDNFEYLLLLNSASGRSFHDLSRYPVFPWVLSDYSSPNLDTSTLLSPFSKTKKAEFTPECNRVFRDLQKPVGALNEQRLEYFQTRYKNMQDMDQAFLYGTHYSAPGYILYYLVRIMPEHMLCLQNGSFFFFLFSM